mgnify:FL=1
MAAVADGADPLRLVWLDIFAVRQWPGNDGESQVVCVGSARLSYVLRTNKLMYTIQREVI